MGDGPRSYWTLTRDVTAVGLLTTVDIVLSFLSLAFFLFVLFPNMRCSFVLVIIPSSPFGHSSTIRAAFEAVTIPSPPPIPWFRVRLRYTHRPCRPRFANSWSMFAWVP
ncbi:hypothetical protein J3R82DRAFT_216 [Butyriboletus roseoflavus]|nr:hypothetical protein J3R82DRAFT_216 [Butyriboletus roseoflavus]